MRLSPVSQRRTAVVSGSPVMGGLALHNDVVPKFLPHQRTGYSAYQVIKSLHQRERQPFGASTAIK